MTDPMTLSMSTEIATLVAKKAVDVVGDAAKEAAGRLIAKVRERLGGRPGTEIALAEAEAEPESDERIQALAEVLRRLAADDPGFGEDVVELFREVSLHVSADHGGVVHIFDGSAKNVVQARDIHGGLNLS